MTRMDVPRAHAYASVAHALQKDKLGVPYIGHVRAVANGLSSFGDDFVIAGLFHDLLEDTEITAQDLLDAGTSARVVAVVEAVTNRPGVPYAEKLASIAKNPAAVLVKISDNAHNSRPDRLEKLPPEVAVRLRAKYYKARDVLWPSAHPEHIRRIIEIVNPDLLTELNERWRDL